MILSPSLFVHSQLIFLIALTNYKPYLTNGYIFFAIMFAKKIFPILHDARQAHPILDFRLEEFNPKSKIGSATGEVNSWL